MKKAGRPQIQTKIQQKDSKRHNKMNYIVSDSRVSLSLDCPDTASLDGLF